LPEHTEEERESLRRRLEALQSPARRVATAEQATGAATPPVDTARMAQLRERLAGLQGRFRAPVAPPPQVAQGGVLGRPNAPGRGILGLRRQPGGGVPIVSTVLGPLAGTGRLLSAVAEGVAAVPGAAEVLERIPLLNRLTSPEQARRAREILASDQPVIQRLQQLGHQFEERPFAQQVALGFATDPLFASGVSRGVSRAFRAATSPSTALVPVRRIAPPAQPLLPAGSVRFRPPSVPVRALPKALPPGRQVDLPLQLRPQVVEGKVIAPPARPPVQPAVQPAVQPPVQPATTGVIPRERALVHLKRVTPPESVPPAMSPPSSASTVQPEGADAVIAWFYKLISGPEQIEKDALTQLWRRQAVAARAQALKIRTAELVKQGVAPRRAIQQATTESMTGKLPSATTSLPSVVTPEIEDALFKRLYDTLKDEPLEMLATAPALTNALLGKSIPRKLGIAGGSAFTRLQRVFGPELVKAIEGRPIRETIAMRIAPRGVSAETRRLPAAIPTVGERPFVIKDIPPDTRTPEARQLDLEAFETLRAQSTRGVSEGLSFPTTLDRVAFEQPALMPAGDKSRLLQAMKTAGLTTLDFGNLIRSNKASFDMSWWRQQAPLIFGNFKEFMLANPDAFRALWSKEFAEKINRSIQLDPLFPVYDSIGADFLRPLEGRTARAWQRAEEFMILGGERPIQRFAERLPWLRISARAHITGSNAMNWRIFKRHASNLYKMNEKIASGEIVLKPGEALDIPKELKTIATMLADMSGRGPVGPLKAITPALNAGFFSFRMASGRAVMARSLFSPNHYTRKEAWKNMVSFLGGMSGLELAGEMMGLWEIEKDPRSADFMKIRVGRIRVDPWGGFQQYVVLMGRLLTGTGISTTTLQEFAARDRLQTIERFIENKKHPFIGIVLETLEGRDFRGKKIDNAAWETWVNRFAMLSLEDMWEAFEAEGFGGGLVGSLGLVGAGILAYEIPTWPEVTPYYALETSKERTVWRRLNPELDAKLFILGRFTTVRTVRARMLVKEIMLQNRIKPVHVRGFEKLFGSLELAPAR